ncbi:response regulator FixJ [Parvibaculum sp.]|uniref:response regulator FixJ n=1 Tax=Parvibaculum sp. TaxID=2024848 RepID=UPI0027206FE5|nr:response regulator FixJ [Parvibaculum sp.]MDO9126155.1 response regulator FixJ [Parvibaculum sp.]MDP1627405.1 response regulator FixJ [Parvibaculum sp.]MDP2148584.1 response regulator FixJ [Parvibaculum sp.]MDP3327541.1 response regulator FixJ [Parvibaculum sp.]
MRTEETVFIVDDDTAVRESLRALLESAALNVDDFSSAAAFLGSYVPHRPGCLVVDIRMPDMDGLELQEELVRRSIELPVIVVTGHADVPLAVRAMKAGAVDFIEKPFDDNLLLDGIGRALEAGRQRRSHADFSQAARTRIAGLTQREREVLEHLVSGQSNKVIAYELDISPRTVEVHRANLMEKMRARTLSDLVRMALEAGVGHGDKT